MQGPWKTICYAAFAFAVLIGAPIPGSQAPFKITISTVQHSFKLGAEIRLEIVLTNTSDQAILVDRDIGPTSAEAGGCSVEVRDDKGNSPPETKYQRVLRGEEPLTEPWVASVATISVDPGKTFSDAMIANKFYDLSKPGKYKIQVQRTDPASKVVVKSNVITVTVTPEPSEHPCRLQGGQRCEDLLK